MGKDCNLELCLFPAGAEANLSSPRSTGSRTSREDSTENSQKLTIFYNGRVCLCNVTELQAREILNLAKKELMDAWPKKTGTESLSRCQPQDVALSMKRSLQQFLQKRKNRIMAASPYSH